MKSSPLFSILLPTKNRSEVVGTAIASVLNQSFKEFELIIADNDDDPEATKNVVNSFDDDRIVYIRTGSLSMVENWESARRSATGRYLTVLEDKQAYYKHTLQSLHDVIQRYSPKIITWKFNHKKKRHNYYDNRYIYDSSFHVIESIKIIEQYLSREEYIKGIRTWHLLPRMINSCISATALRDIISCSQNANFFDYYAPDIVSAFKQLFTINHLYFTRKKLGYLSSRQSNAKILVSNRSKSQDYFSGTSPVSWEFAVRNVQIKQPDIISNLVYNDYLTVKNQFAVTDLEMNNCTYAFMCYREIMLRRKDKGSHQETLEAIYSYVDNALSLKDKKCFKRKVLLSKLIGLKWVH